MAQKTPEKTTTNETVSDRYEMSVFDIFLPIIRHIKIFIFIIVLFIAGAVTYALMATLYYQSTAKISPIQDPTSSVSRFSNITAALGIQPSNGSGTTTTFLMLLLESRTLRNRVYDAIEPDILANLYPEAWDTKNKKWKDPNFKPRNKQWICTFFVKDLYESIENATHTSIAINAETTDPEFSARVAATVIEELDIMLKEKNITTAERNKHFIKGQLLKNKKKLIEETTKLSQYHKQYEVSSQSALIKIDLAQDESPEDLAEIGVHERIIKDIPANIYLNYLSGRLEVLKMVNSVLEQQYVYSVIEANKNRPGFYILDKPEVPIQRSRPSRKFIVMVTTLLGVVFSYMFCFFYDYLKKNYAAIKENLRTQMNS